MISFPRLEKKGSKIYPKKRFSQHFLVNLEAARRIVGYLDLKHGQKVLEIGPGKGVLTKYLLEKEARVYGVELDSNLCRYLKERFRGEENLELINQDILRFDLKKIVSGKGEIKAIGNLPYQITSPILEYLIRNRELIDIAILTVQKEVAKRICAEPDTADWSPLSIGIQLFSEPEILFTLRPNSFHPPPKVYSAVLRIKFLTDPKVKVKLPFFSNFVKAIFSSRRKNLLNSLSIALSHDKKKVKSILEKAEIEVKKRAESLSLEELARLARSVSENN